jgi:hypothetical protein
MLPCNSLQSIIFSLMQVEWKELGRLIEDDRRMREALKREYRHRMRHMHVLNAGLILSLKWPFTSGYERACVCSKVYHPRFVN